MTSDPTRYINEKASSCCCISHLFHNAALQSPNKIAVVHASGGARIARHFHNICQTSHTTSNSSHDSVPPYEGDECFTYFQILNAVDSLSVRLRRIFDGFDDPYLIKPFEGNITSEQNVNIPESSNSLKVIPKIVGIYMEPSVEYIIAVLSVLRCGEAFMPLDPSWPNEKILSILSSSKPNLVIGHKHKDSVNNDSFHKLDELSWLLHKSCPVLPISCKHYINKQSDPLLHLDWPCKNKKKLTSFCYLMYTSGSTGQPKGVCGTEKGLLNRYLWMQEQYPLHGNEHLLFKTSISFIDHLQEFLGALLTTSMLIIPPFSELKQNIFYVVDFLQLYDINRFIAVPSLLRTILSVMQSEKYVKIPSCLKLIVLSGEIFHVTLWEALVELLPNTTILNLYGSTEVTGDCTYFDCKKLRNIMESEKVESVPIGKAIRNCYIRLGEEGEIYVSGECVSSGYFSYPLIIPHECVKLGEKCYLKTGDFGKELKCGELVFLGRKDRLVKVNGHRVSLDEIENRIKEHSHILDSAVILLSSFKGAEQITLLEAHVVKKKNDDNDENLISSIRNWLLIKLPSSMVPTRIFFRETLPKTSSGKVDYSFLSSLTSIDINNTNTTQHFPNAQVIQNVFCDTLMVEKISMDDNFFEMGGNSISAAYACYKLGINMKLLYAFPTPLQLQMALEDKVSLSLNESTSSISSKSIDDSDYPSKYLKTDDDTKVDYASSCVFSRCNKVTHGEKCGELCSKVSLKEISRPSMKQLWKVYMESCVDASPLIILKETDIFLFIGSHSNKFVSINAKDGSIRWETKLQGRIECSAAILDDISQVIVGCYQGYIYFLHFLDGHICWSFQTGGQVKSQPVVDKSRKIVWCGSYDHNLYALDYKKYSCVYKVHCGGSVFGSPVIDEVRGKLFVASTSGRITAILLKERPFCISWVQELEAPIFGSLSINYVNGNVICCSVDGSVHALDTSGNIIWKAKTGGPIFAGPCISHTLPTQVVICCTDGCVYSFELEKGQLLWEYRVGQSMSSSAYVDEHLHLASAATDRLICVCTSIGNIHVLRLSGKEENVVEEYAKVKLSGDIFSSPVMIAGKIYIGSRDDYVYCITLYH